MSMCALGFVIASIVMFSGFIAVLAYRATHAFET